MNNWCGCNTVSFHSLQVSLGQRITTRSPAEAQRDGDIWRQTLLSRIEWMRQGDQGSVRGFSNSSIHAGHAWSIGEIMMQSSIADSQLMLDSWAWVRMSEACFHHTLWSGKPSILYLVSSANTFFLSQMVMELFRILSIIKWTNYSRTSLITSAVCQWY